LYAGHVEKEKDVRQGFSDETAVEAVHVLVIAASEDNMQG
jgi:hypothetical protein